VSYHTPVGGFSTAAVDLNVAVIIFILLFSLQFEHLVLQLKKPIRSLKIKMFLEGHC